MKAMVTTTAVVTDPVGLDERSNGSNTLLLTVHAQRRQQTRPARADRPEVDLRRLVSGFLRMAPDIAIVGAVRDR